MHLGMTGSFRIEAAAAERRDVPGAYYHARGTERRHDHVASTLETASRITYNDPRRFGFMTLLTRAELADPPAVPRHRRRAAERRLRRRGAGAAHGRQGDAAQGRPARPDA